MSDKPQANIQFEGLDIELRRDEDGVIAIDIQSGDLPPADTHLDTGVPRLRVHVNEDSDSLNSAGEWHSTS